jgi:hypothetical protein
MHENSDVTMKINEINVELSGNSQRYVNECCKSESNRKIDGVSAGYCKPFFYLYSLYLCSSVPPSALPSCMILVIYSMASSRSMPFSLSSTPSLLSYLAYLAISSPFPTSSLVSSLHPHILSLLSSLSNISFSLVWLPYIT